MDSGFPLQKSWVMQNLSLIPAPASLLQHIFVISTKKNVINYPEELQLECGSGILQCIKQNLIPDSLKLECIQVSLTFLSFYSRTLHQKWLPVYSNLLHHIPISTIKQKLLPELMLLSDCSQKAITREVSCHLLGELAVVFGKEFKGPLLQRVKSLSQDTSPEVREEMAKVWIQIIKVLGKNTIEETVFFDILKLIDDEVLGVRVQGVKLLIFVLEFVSESFFLKEVNQVLRNCIFSKQPKEIENVICENLGKIAVGCFGSNKSELLVLMKKFVMNENYRKSLAFNYPGLVQIIGLTNDIKEIGLTLLEDRSHGVQKTFAAGFHEVLSMNKHCKILKKIASKLLEEPECRSIIFKKLSIWSTLYDPSQLLIKYIKHLTLSLDWRTQTDLFHSFIAAFSNFSLKEVLDHFIPLILHKMLTSCWPAKSAACHTLCFILTNTYYIPRKLDICNIVKEKLARSNSSYDRVLFLEFCEQIASFASDSFFSKYFLQDFLNLSLDQVPSVLIKFFRSCQVIGTFGFKSNILETLEHVEFNSNKKILLNNLIEYLKSPETELKILENSNKNKQKKAFEAQLESMEVREVENIKKRTVDEAALKVTGENNNKNKKLVIKGRIHSESIDPKSRTTRSTAMIKPPQPVKKK